MPSYLNYRPPGIVRNAFSEILLPSRLFLLRCCRLGHASSIALSHGCTLPIFWILKLDD
jgi:hypothetical protein